jgi:hypothetical protein
MRGILIESISISEVVVVEFESIGEFDLIGDRDFVC